MRSSRILLFAALLTLPIACDGSSSNPLTLSSPGDDANLPGTPQPPPAPDPGDDLGGSPGSDGGAGAGIAGAGGSSIPHDLGNQGGPSVALSPQGVVARVALPQPELASFVLHATLPLLPGVHFDDSTTSPFAVVSPHGKVTPAQTEVVTRFARISDGADVVEIISLVERDPSVAVGQQVVYDVVLAPHAAQQPPGPPSVTALGSSGPAIPSNVANMLKTPFALILVSQDVFGNFYILDPLHGGPNARWQRYGHTAAEVRAYGTMTPIVPVTGAQGTLPHLFGVHSYARTFAGEQLFELDMRVNNGADGGFPQYATDDPLGKVYFKQLWMLLPNGWFAQQAFEDPSLGQPFILGNFTVVPLIQENADGTMHLMPETGQFERRLVISPVENRGRARAFLEQQGQAFCQPGVVNDVELLSWWNPQTARYFPQRHLLPDLAHIDQEVQQELDGEFNWMMGFFETGTGYGDYPIKHDLLGWAHPHGVEYGGMSGGSEIDFMSGVRTAWAASTAGYRQLQLVHRMQTDRQPNAYYQLNGESSSLEEWLEPNLGGAGPYIDMIFYMRLWQGDPMGFVNAPEFQINAVEAQGLKPAYEDTLLLFDIHDLEHLIRYIRNAKAMAWLGNDSLAKDDLHHQAEMFHLTYNQYFNSKWGYASEAGLRSDRTFVQTHPGVGFEMGRAEGWGIDAMNVSYALSPSEWRQRKHNWYDEVVEVLVDGQASCSGFIQAYVYEKMLDGKYRVRQSIEAAIMENAMRGMLESSFRGRDAVHTQMLEDVMRKSFYAMVGAESWTPGNSGPWTQLAVGPLDVSLPPYCGYVPPGGQSLDQDTFQTPTSLAYAYELTGDPLFLQKAADMFGPATLAQLLTDKTLHIGNRAALIALLQNP